MNVTVTRVFPFLLVVLGIYLWIGYTITELTGGGRTSSAAVDISPEGGEAMGMRALFAFIEDHFDTSI